ncbi:pyridoxamine 5'-phosphate oxidase family protein [Enterococcus pallens]|uniref:5-nitroimidazole antibiotic resistance protein n=1 Tax=Enterococcus pallens ATCC BAA-351 TaxID=1158607 RepID=R2PVQ6_9ENTE|nr:pyridoxamine 5'-phosphate oxidase family protein [Enterococcus pallens]EOH88577.1 hypothetical protein UAU_04396 [Enterococcus pallens ATCC BAA-351]EOU17758.1 hypothetical protein I588_02745 [Enterococcus pallens ATCC BAA-351]OJG81635.1 hypothetical protein RV10_GL002874 [Enterococcus pallens]
MRRKERQVTDLENIKALVETCQVVRIAFNGSEYPYIVPVNYGYKWEEEQLILYVHGATQGEKISRLQADEKVAIEMDDKHALIEGGNKAERFSYAYESIIGFGKAELLSDIEEKRLALHALMDHAAKGVPFDEIPERMIERTGIIKITVSDYTMKQHKPKTKM